ncbi:hypothetical protein ABI_14350 [Asticcacaulis biprosthecium C19]|uniref:Lipoprotein n=1 Tax=Asticcacaulis biprosthecium C19 TaxID=715226 RepID=F4QIK7_9CAUL|nr:DUF3313 family protein [Asticcacaulis biprosthecium]EGF92996.1 hypothetical protein ABI_14350 [Asticcacaulis biprosthecium C19]
MNLYLCAVMAGVTTLLLGGCASAPLTTASTLSSADQLTPGKTGRTTTREYRDGPALAQVKRVYLHPTELVTGDAARYTLKDDERELVLAEVEAQLCFELAERFELVREPGQSDAEVTSAVTWFEPTGTAGSGAAAAVNFFIPGPLGVRLPGTLGGLGGEAEMTAGKRQIAAIVWARQAQAVGTDSPSLSRLGDALQFAEPFADDVARVMSPDTLPQPRTYTAANDPCAAYGDRIQAAGFIFDKVTGVYVPSGRRKVTTEGSGN